MGTTPPPIQRAPGFFLGSEAAEAWSWPITCIYVQVKNEWSCIRERLKSQISLPPPPIRSPRPISRPGIARISQLVQRLGYELEDPGLKSRYGQDIFLSYKTSRPDGLWGPPRLLFRGYRAYFLAVKRPKREADHLPVSSAGLRMNEAVFILPLH